jgi:hypothetical protein
LGYRLKIITEVNKIPFKSSGRQTVDPGWKAIFQDAPDENEEKAPNLLIKGDFPCDGGFTIANPSYPVYTISDNSLVFRFFLFTRFFRPKPYEVHPLHEVFFFFYQNRDVTNIPMMKID